MFCGSHAVAVEPLITRVAKKRLVSNGNRTTDIVLVLMIFLLRSIIAWLFNEGTYLDTEVPEAPKLKRQL